MHVGAAWVRSQGSICRCMHWTRCTAADCQLGRSVLQLVSAQLDSGCVTSCRVGCAARICSRIWMCANGLLETVLLFGTLAPIFPFPIFNPSFTHSTCIYRFSSRGEGHGLQCSCSRGAWIPLHGFPAWIPCRGSLALAIFNSSPALGAVRRGTSAADFAPFSFELDLVFTLGCLLPALFPTRKPRAKVERLTRRTSMATDQGC